MCGIVGFTSTEIGKEKCLRQLAILRHRGPDMTRCMQVSHEVTWKDVKNVPLPKRAFRVILRLFAPLL